MYIPALETREQRDAVAASERVAAALAGDDSGDVMRPLYYVPLGKCGACNGNDRVAQFILGKNEATLTYCAQTILKEGTTKERMQKDYPCLRGFLRRVGVDVDALLAD